MSAHKRFCTVDIDMWHGRVCFDQRAKTFNRSDNHNFYFYSTKLVPRTLLVGHKAPIAAICLGRVEVESVATQENIIVTASEDG